MRSFLVIVLVSMVTTWNPVSSQDLSPINPDNLDPGAAHVCQSTEQEPYTQIGSFTQYVTEKTTTWCLAFPPRCTQYRIAARTAYRVETLYRKRVKYFCCAGYKALPQHTYCVPKCDNDCHAAKSQGFCVTPGNCVCYPGYKGTSCESGCPNNQWGPNCSNRCNCGTHGSCDPENGNCVCQVGYTGTDCSQPCVGSFGLHCVHPCVCENNATCNNVNGMCTCKPGFYGAYCHKKCDPTMSSQTGCEQTCPCQNGGQCQTGTGTCVCAPGFMGEFCAEACDRFHWGVNCTKQCECNFGVCNRVTGECSCELGYAGQRCEIKCPPGYYGIGCLTKCGCENDGKCYWNSTLQQIRCNCTGTGYHGDRCSDRDCPHGQYLVPGAGTALYPCQNCTCDTNPERTRSCHPLTGKCLCEAGYKGETCSEKCTMPFYGEKCSQMCSCEHGDCNHLTGECIACYPGYLGVNCTEHCPEGKWGLGCVNTCDCKNQAVCDIKTGFCLCLAGYQGQSCEKTCSASTFGPACSKNCTCNLDTSVCSPYDGQCQCKPGYTGVQCLTKCLPWKYDFFCQKDCDCNIEGAVSCDHRTGHCHCKGGWSGLKCDTKCPDHTWGPNCVNFCDCSSKGSCHPDKGYCVCLDGYQGDRCQQDANGAPISVIAQQTGSKTDTAAAGTTPIIIAVVIPCVILLLIIAAVVIYFMRKIRIIKDENYRVDFNANQANANLAGQTTIPNGHAHHGLENPTYEDDNRHNDSRYPHLSQRFSAAPPPLPHRQKSHDPLDDIDAEKLRVAIEPRATTRPVSSQYADIDDVDRYTTLKAISSATLSSVQAQKGTGEFEFNPDDKSEGQRSRSSSDSSSSGASGAVKGFDNPSYADPDKMSSKLPGQAAGSVAVPLYDNDLSGNRQNSKRQQAVASSTGSMEIDLVYPGAFEGEKKAPSKYDVPKSLSIPFDKEKKASHEYDVPVSSAADSNQSGSFLNSNWPPNPNLSVNQYDVPVAGGIKSDEIFGNQPRESSGYLVPTGNQPRESNGYLTPKMATDFHGDLKFTDSKVMMRNPNSSDHDPAREVSAVYLHFDDSDLHLDGNDLDSSPFHGNDKNTLIKARNQDFEA